MAQDQQTRRSTAQVLAQEVFNGEVALAESFGAQADATTANQRKAAVRDSNQARGALRQTLRIAREFGLQDEMQELYRNRYGKSLPIGV